MNLFKSFLALFAGLKPVVTPPPAAIEFIEFPIGTQEFKTNQEIADIMADALEVCHNSIKSFELDEQAHEFLKQAACMKVDKEGIETFIQELGDSAVKEPCEKFDQAMYDMRYDIANLDFEDYNIVHQAKEEGQRLVMAIAESIIMNAIKTTIIQYATSDEGSKEVKKSMVDNMIILSAQAGEA